MANVARTRTSACGKEVTDLPTRAWVLPILLPVPQHPLDQDNCRWYYQKLWRGCELRERTYCFNAFSFAVVVSE